MLLSVAHSIHEEDHCFALLTLLAEFHLVEMLERPNDERSHAGPVASGCNQDAIPALADAFC